MIEDETRLAELDVEDVEVTEPGCHGVGTTDGMRDIHMVIQGFNAENLQYSSRTFRVH
jgi:hypothetical protein